LITLGIIGVVAAMTIPTLMAKINERQTVSKLKKAYSTLSNAMRILEHDDDIDWNSCLTLFDYDAGRNECDQKLATTMKATYQSGTNLSTPGVSQWVTSVLQTMEATYQSENVSAPGTRWGRLLFSKQWMVILTTF
jgi:type II secretory pathway pseudopilin PulG